MDATAVDSHRRLVLVRRDDIEHLLLIGGPTDVVVERDIRIGHTRRPAAPVESAHEAQIPSVPAPLPTPPHPAPLPASARRAPEPLRTPSPPPASRTATDHVPAQAAPRAPEPPRATLAATPAPQRPEVRSASVMPATSTPKDALPPSSDDLDDALLKELEVSLDDGEPAPRKAPTPSLDDEMAKLLGELSKSRR
jgi:hypothetical protein